jgi:hypothetical protein
MKTLLCIFSVLCLVSCNEVSFPTHQPKGITPLKAFPKELRGYYLTTEGDSIQDTIQIEERSYRTLDGKPNSEKSWLDAAEISDSLVVKKYKGLYFINFKENNEWLLRILKRDKKGNLTFMMMAINDSEKVKSLSELEKELPVQVIELSDNEKYYRIDPTPKQLMSLIKKKKFWEKSELIKLK